MSFNSLLGETGRNSSISSNPTPTKKRIRLSKSVVHDHSPRQEVSIYISEKVKSCTVPSQVKLQVKSKVKSQVRTPVFYTDCRTFLFLFQ